MVEILWFPDTHENLVRRNAETPVSETKASLWELLTKTPESVTQLIRSDYNHPQEVLVVNPEKLKELIIDYIIFHLGRAKISLENSGVLFWVQYISDLLFKIFLFTGEEIKLIVEHPYFTHWMQAGYPKRAGDASVYSYMFRDPKHPAKREDYIDFAVSWYAGWEKRDIQISGAVGQILPEIWWMVRDDRFLKRGVMEVVR